MMKKMTTHKKGKKKKRKEIIYSTHTQRKPYWKLFFQSISFFFFFFNKENEHSCHTYGTGEEDCVANTMRMYLHMCCLGAFCTSVQTGRTRTRQSWSKSSRPSILQLTTPISIQPTVERRSHWLKQGYFSSSLMT